MNCLTKCGTCCQGAMKKTGIEPETAAHWGAWCGVKCLLPVARVWAYGKEELDKYRDWDLCVMRSGPIQDFYAEWPRLSRAVLIPFNLARGVLKWAINNVIEAISVVVYPIMAFFAHDKSDARRYLCAAAVALVNSAIVCMLVSIYLSNPSVGVDLMIAAASGTAIFEAIVGLIGGNIYNEENRGSLAIAARQYGMNWGIQKLKGRAKSESLVDILGLGDNPPPPPDEVIAAGG